MASTRPVDTNGRTGKPPGEDDALLRRHKWLAVLINELSRKSNKSEDILELNIPRQIADVALGMCWASSPDEYEDMRASVVQVLHEQHKHIAETLPSWIDEFGTGSGRREHPSQRQSLLLPLT